MDKPLDIFNITDADEFEHFRQTAADRESNDDHLSPEERKALLDAARVFDPCLHQTGETDSDFVNLIF